MKRLAVWIGNRGRREQMVLALALVVALIWAAAQLIWQPLHLDRMRLVAAIARHEQALQLLARLPAATAAAASDPRPVAALVTETVPDYGLAINRLDGSADRAEVVMNEAAWDGLILWLDAVETDLGLSLTAIDLTRRPGPGMVAARLTLERRAR